jgi:hypothetical protein
MPILKAQAFPNHTLAVYWTDGSMSLINVAPVIFTLRTAAPLRNDFAAFGRVKVRPDRSALYWPDIGADIAEYTLRRLPAPTMTAPEFCAICDELNLTVSAVAETLALSRRVVSNYRSGESPVPRAVAYAMRHLRQLVST